MCRDVPCPGSPAAADASAQGTATSLRRSHREDPHRMRSDARTERDPPPPLLGRARWIARRASDRCPHPMHAAAGSCVLRLSE